MTAGDSGEAPHAESLVSIQRTVLEYWDRTGLPRLLQAGTPGGAEFRFTEGPPTANGVPHLGHLISRILKDTVVRYHRMRGAGIVSPMAGWDCHGLPVELEIEKKHGLKSKKEIEAFGVEQFCDECRASTLSVAEVWQEMSRRVGYWLDYDHPYLTMAPSYIESVWWSLKLLFDRGLLEKGFYVLPYCPRCETPLSSHEVAQGYKETTDPSVTVRLRLRTSAENVPRYLLVWTTTPWTLPTNLLVAVHPEIPYVVVSAPDGTEWILAEGALPRYFPEGPATIVERRAGSSLQNLEYEPLFPFAGAGSGRYRVVLDPMVDTKEGTGLVHIAPSFGSEDQRIGEREGVGQFDPLDSRGVFTDAVPIVQGKSFKAADKVLLEGLSARGAVVQSGSLRHTYPFCWRCSTPLIYRAIDSWFVRTSRFTSELRANNQEVRWVPSHLRDGRFGNFLEEAKDWALSRNRYWGTPLPIWQCTNHHFTAVGSFAELGRLQGSELPGDFDPHRVTVDRISFPCPTCGMDARREPFTIDAWYDSGSAPFAQYHYPFESGPFRPELPLDYVAEGLDQTRGWFYTLLVLSTALFHRPAYRVCLTNGLVLDEAGQKMSKSRGNVTEPMGLLERYGGDAVRWTFLMVDYTESMKFNEAAFRLTGARTLHTLTNAVRFYVANARIDGLAATTLLPPAKTVLDRWLLSRLDRTIEEVDRALSEYDPRKGTLAIGALVDDLSTWYLRRSRPRFWQEGRSEDRRAANEVLSFTLVEITRLLAPFAPFTSEFLFHALFDRSFTDATHSVHRAGWPALIGRYELALEAGMEALRSLAEMGRELRQRAGVKSRIPLRTLVLFGSVPPAFQDLGSEGERLLADELNVRTIAVEATFDADRYPDEDWILRMDGGTVVAALERRPTVELKREGQIREVLRRLQMMRKELRLEYTDHVDVAVYAPHEWAATLEAAESTIRTEALADRLAIHPGPAPPGASTEHFEIDGATLEVRMERSRSTG